MKGLIDTLQERGFIDSITSDSISKHLETKQKVYVGFDPTADSLHLGNLVGIIGLRWFQKFGHVPVVVLGGATGRIGDPSGKSHERPLLDDETLSKNVESISKHFERCLDYTDKQTTPVITNNNDWFKKFSFIDFLRDTGKHFRLGTMLAKDSVKTRLNSEEGISFTEFSYQVVQGYDFYHLSENENVTIQMGGSDQWGNITAGMELTRKLSRKEVFGVTFSLLTRSDGKKFGKSEEGAIWLAKEKCSPYKFYQYLFGMPDADVISLLKMLTFLPLEEIEDIRLQMESHPNIAQRKLAEEVTFYVHGEEGLAIANKVTDAIRPGSKAALDMEILQEVAEDMPSVFMSKSDVSEKKFTEVASESGLCSSKGEALRLIKNGGAYLNNEKILDADFVVQSNHILGDKYVLLGSGKKKKLLIKFS